MKFNLEIINEKDKTRIEKSIKTYFYLQESLRKEMPLDKEFKVMYCKYYGLNRFFTEQDKEVYFSVFEEQRKTKQHDFEQTLKDLRKIKGKVWVSFASKMLASINPSLPIWDSIVFEKLHKEKGLSKLSTSKDHTKKIEKDVLCYEQLKKCIGELKAEAERQNFFQLFLKEFSQAEALTPEKMLDFYLWGIRNK